MLMRPLILCTNKMSSKGDLMKYLIYLLGNSYKVRTIMKMVYSIRKVLQRLSLSSVMGAISVAASLVARDKRYPLLRRDN